MTAKNERGAVMLESTYCILISVFVLMFLLSFGFLLYQKRLERGSFEMPRKNADTGYYELSWETFSFIMSGVSLESVQFRKRYRTRFICR